MADITQFDYTGGEKVQSNVNASDHPNAYALSLELATLLDNQKSAHTDWNAIRTKLREIITELNAKVRTDALITAIDTALGSSDWQTDTNTQLTQEQVQDFAATILNHAGHTNVSVSYDEANNRIILSSSDTDTQLTEEQVQDFAAPLLNHANHSNVSVSYDDANNQIILTVASSGSGGVSDLPLQVNFDSDLDTTSAQVTFKGAKTFSDLFFDSKLSGVTFEVKLASASTWTAQADLTALNSWVTSNVTTPSTLWQIRLIADFGANSGEADATLIYT